VSWALHGLVVVPIGPDGRPSGAAFWCKSAEQATTVQAQHGGHERAVPLLMYRPDGGKHESKAPGPAPA
jgi:hypothetical protein